MKNKFSWGKGITIFIILFLIFNFIIIYFAFNQNVELVTQDYYEKDLLHEAELQKQRNSQALTEQIKIDVVNSFVKIQIPQEFVGKNIEGEIYFYRPSDSKKDFRLSLIPNEYGIQEISGDKFIRGLWKINIQWKSEAKLFSDSKTIFIN